jgi:periplasmic protein TonB
LFDQTFVDTHVQTRRPWTLAASLTIQTVLVAILLLSPLLHIAALQPPETLPLLLSLQPLRQPPQPPAKATPQTAAARPIFRGAVLQAPVSIPKDIDMTADAPELATGYATPDTGVSQIIGLIPGIAVPPPAAAIPSAKTKPIAPPAAPVRVGSGVQSAKLIFGPKPAYPRLALATRTQGTVRIQALIGRDGAIRNLQVLSGPPLLLAAAIEAVKQWRYRPTLLNSEPVEVVTEIDVNFTIGQ